MTVESAEQKADGNAISMSMWIPAKPEDKLPPGRMYQSGLGQIFVRWYPDQQRIALIIEGHKEQISIHDLLLPICTARESTPKEIIVAEQDSEDLLIHFEMGTPTIRVHATMAQILTALFRSAQPNAYVFCFAVPANPDLKTAELFYFAKTDSVLLVKKAGEQATILLCENEQSEQSLAPVINSYVEAGKFKIIATTTWSHKAPGPIVVYQREHDSTLVSVPLIKVINDLLIP